MPCLHMSYMFSSLLQDGRLAQNTVLKEFLVQVRQRKQEVRQIVAVVLFILQEKMGFFGVEKCFERKILTVTYIKVTFSTHEGDIETFL